MINNKIEVRARTKTNFKSKTKKPILEKSGIFGISWPCLMILLKVKNLSS